MKGTTPNCQCYSDTGLIDLGFRISEAEPTMQEVMMHAPSISRRTFARALGGAVAGNVVARVFKGRALAAESVRHGIQIGALGALRMTLPEAGKKYGLMYDMKDFR